MRRSTVLTTLVAVLAPLAFVACGDDDSTNTPTAPTPVAVSETFSDTLNVNGARVHLFSVNQSGTVTAVLTALSPDTATVGVALGTWSTLTGGACQLIIAKDNVTLTDPPTSVVGTASVGQFCIRVSDATGTLPQATDYSVTVSHF